MLGATQGMDIQKAITMISIHAPNARSDCKKQLKL